MKEIHKLLLAILLIGMLTSVQGQARRGPRPPGPVRRPTPSPRRIVRLPAGARRIVIGGIPYWYHAGLYYKLGSDGYVVVSLPVKRVLPPRHRVILIGGVVYYVKDGIYYRSVPGGYIIVDKPIVKVKESPAPPETIKPQEKTLTLYVPKKNEEGFVPVILKRLEGGFLGPQGEFYPSAPRIEWLTEMYGIPLKLRQVRSDTFFIHVPDKNGDGFTRVALKRHKSGFRGPQGEFYPLMPSVAQLTEMYGASEKPIETEDEIITIKIPKKTGDGSVEVKLTKHDDGYLGPQGEFYPEMPSEDLLSELYGK